MKYTFIFFIQFVLFTTLHSNVIAQQKSEHDLISKIIQSLSRKDSFMYASVFVPADSLAQIIVRKAPANSPAVEQSKMMLSSPEFFVYQDSIIIRQCSEWFRNVLDFGVKIGVHWNAIQLSRFELENTYDSQDTILKYIADEQFVGYVTIIDMLTQKHYTFTLSDILKIGKNFYGGSLNLILLAQGKEDFKNKMKVQKTLIARGLAIDTSDYVSNEEYEEEDDRNYKRKQVEDRKYFGGYLDDETPVRLYIRYIKGGCPEGICSWEALFKYGEYEYIRLDVSKTKDGKWLFTDESYGWALELEESKNSFHGIFSATIDNVDYDASLKERNIPKKKLQKLDAIIERDFER